MTLKGYRFFPLFFCRLWPIFTCFLWIIALSPEGGTYVKYKKKIGNSSDTHTIAIKKKYKLKATFALKATSLIAVFGFHLLQVFFCFFFCFFFASAYLSVTVICPQRKEGVCLFPGEHNGVCVSQCTLYGVRGVWCVCCVCQGH